ncbi:cryptochrome/photolyase family protein [Microcella sp.]|uniref:cryptochrome/photolyase family protein n=1 Tax=Microcella sp. TaxID=1913979 RepID=UPI00299F7438|nr:cryptochrome/photolyase family protein [Microcella sp.]MDX2026720.1 cryptochrome/photolyase family protein [Microcella sp.]
MTNVPTRWLTAEQLGPAFDDGGPIVLIENTTVFRRRPTHRQKAHLYLTALRHRARELGERGTFLQASSYRAALTDAGLAGGALESIDPPSWAARRLVRELGASILPSRGFVTSEHDFATWAAGRKPTQLVMDRFYRDVRERTGILMTPGGPEGGQFSFDADNRQPPPKGAESLGLPAPWRPVEDDIDAEVRAELDRLDAEGVRFLGHDGPRQFAATRAEALAALDDFVETRLTDFGPYEDAMMLGDDTMAHARLSVPLNLGLLHPLEVVDRVVAEHAAGRAPLASVEGIVRQLIGWRDWVWHLYWHLGPDYTRRSNALAAHQPLPHHWWALDGSATDARCLSHTLDTVGGSGYAHHIPRLMVLGNAALQRGYDPAELTEWFQGAFVDGTPWVMPANVVGMSQFADGGVMASKPYVASGKYIQRMSNYCRSCPHDPARATGPGACPFTTLYWDFLLRHEHRLRGNPRTRLQVQNLHRLAPDERRAIREGAGRLRLPLVAPEEFGR